MNPVDELAQNLIQFYHKNVDFEDSHDLLVKFDNYVDHQFPKISHTFLSHYYTPYPYRIELQNKFSKYVYDRLTNFEVNLKIQKNDFSTISELNIFPIHNLNAKVDSLIIFGSLKKSEKGGLYTLCENLQALYQLLIKQRSRLEFSLLTHYANLISQYSHDLNSLVFLLNKEKLSSEQIIFKVEYLESLSQDMLTYCRELDIFKSSINVNELLSSILTEINISGEIDFHYSIESDLGNATFDIELITKAIMAIMDNAIRAANQRGGKIDFIANRKDSNSIFFKTSWLQIIVTDNGPGIPSEFLSMIINPFFTTFKDQGSTGFGLALVQKIIQAHDGLLTVENNKPVGARVIIFLPLDN